MSTLSSPSAAATCCALLSAALLAGCSSSESAPISPPPLATSPAETANQAADASQESLPELEPLVTSDADIIPGVASSADDALVFIDRVDTPGSVTFTYDVHVHSISQAQEIAKYPVEGKLISSYLAHDGKLFILRATEFDRTLTVHDLKTGEEISSGPMPGNTTTCIERGYGRWNAGTNIWKNLADGTICRYDFESGDYVEVANLGTDIHLSPDGGTLVARVSGSEDSWISLNPQTLEVLGTFEAFSESNAAAVNGGQIASAGRESLWEPDTGFLRTSDEKIPGFNLKKPEDERIVPTDNTVVFLGRVAVDIRSGEKLGTLPQNVFPENVPGLDGSVVFARHTKTSQVSLFKNPGA